MINKSALNILIVEPNNHLQAPYTLLLSPHSIIRVSSVELALSKLNTYQPSLVFLSASFSAPKSLKFIAALKNLCHKSLIPLIITIDLSNRLNFVPGISWGGKIAIIDSKISKKEFDSTLNRVLKLT